MEERVGNTSDTQGGTKRIVIDSEPLTYEKSFTSREIADLFNFDTSTIRKYCIALESSGYFIPRNERKHRIFTDSDIIILRKVKDLVSKGLFVGDAAEIVCVGENISKKVPHAPATVPEEDPAELTKKLDLIVEYFSKQEEMTKKLIQEFEKDRELMKKDRELIAEDREQMERDRELAIEDRELAKKNAELVAKELVEMKEMNYKLMQKIEDKEEAEVMDKNVEKSVDKKKNLFLRLFKRD